MGGTQSASPRQLYSSQSHSYYEDLRMASAPLRNNSARTPYSRLPVAEKTTGRASAFGPRKFSLNTSLPPKLESVPEVSSATDSQIPTRTNSSASVDHTTETIGAGGKPSGLHNFRQKFGLKPPSKITTPPSPKTPKTSKIPQISASVKTSKSAPNSISFAPIAQYDSFVVDQSPAVELPPTTFGSYQSTMKAKLSLSPLASSNKPTATVEPVAKLQAKLSNGTVNIDKRSAKPMNLPVKPTILPVVFGSKNKLAETLNKWQTDSHKSPTKSEAGGNLQKSTPDGATEEMDKSTPRLTRENEIDDILTPVETYSSARRISSRRYEYQQKLIRSGSKSIDSASPSESTTQSRSGSISSLASDTQNGKFQPSLDILKSSVPLEVKTDPPASSVQNPMAAEFSSPSDMSGLSTNSAVSPDDSESNNNEKLNKGRGLIDDDYCDQPGLVTNATNNNRLDQPTGPVKRRLPMSDSFHCDSMTSSVSIEDDDCMLDYMGESVDLGSAGLDESVMSISYGPIRMRRGDTSSLKKRHSIKSKRSSLTSVQDELDTLVKDQSATNSVQMVSEQRSNSITSETAGRPQNGRPLMRPPASLRAYQSSIDGQTISGLADSTLTLSMAQDVTVVKTLLLRLRRILQEAETVNPFETSMNLKNGLIKNNDSTGNTTSLSTEECLKEIGDLKRQNATLKHIIEDKDKLISELRREIAETKANGIHKADQMSTTV